MASAGLLECQRIENTDNLIITYTIHNRGPSELGVFNRIPRVNPDGTTEFSPNVAYVDLKGEALMVREMTLPIPPGLKMAAYVAPHVSRLPTLAKLSWRIILPFPVKVMHPFKRAQLDGQVVADPSCHCNPFRAVYRRLYPG